MSDKSAIEGCGAWPCDAATERALADRLAAALDHLEEMPVHNGDCRIVPDALAAYRAARAAAGQERPESRGPRA